VSAAAVAAAGWLSAGAALIAVAWTRARFASCAALVAEASHELRGPLCAAQLGLDLLARTRPQDAGHLTAIELELRRAGLALEDLTIAADGRRGTGTGVDALVDVGALVRDLAPGWQALAAANHCSLAVAAEPGAVIHADQLRLAQAIGNLVSNAVHHGGAGVRVAVTPGGRHARVEVQDEGPGLPAPVSELVRAARGRTTPHGHGIAVADRIASEHGGRLAAAPATRGARLVLEFRLAEIGGMQRWAAERAA
jgi:signal transduction histidine kinase